MESVAYFHLYSAYEEPQVAVARNGSLQDSKLIFCLLPTLMVASTLTTINPVLAALSVGSSGPAVAELQNRLKDLGYFPKDVKTTGYFGTITQQATLQFQRTNNLPADGTIGSQTSVALGMTETQGLSVSVDPLRLGSSGDRVKQVQMQLAALAYYKGKIDGVFTASTQEAVINFQRDTALEADGIVGPTTGNALDQKVEGI